MVIIDGVPYEPITTPVKYGEITITRYKPKDQFDADGGYPHITDRFPITRWKIQQNLVDITEAELNFLLLQMEVIGRSSFWFVIPTSLSPGHDGLIHPVGLWCKWMDDELPCVPVRFGRWRATLNFLSLGDKVRIDAP